MNQIQIQVEIDTGSKLLRDKPSMGRVVTPSSRSPFVATRGGAREDANVTLTLLLARPPLAADSPTAKGLVGSKRPPVTS